MYVSETQASAYLDVLHPVGPVQEALRAVLAHASAHPVDTACNSVGALLVFVDCMKELPATLLLRPLGFETLATHLYGEAVQGTYEDATIAALLIVLAGLLPVLVLVRLRTNVPV